VGNCTHTHLLAEGTSANKSSPLQRSSWQERPERQEAKAGCDGMKCYGKSRSSNRVAAGKQAKQASVDDAWSVIEKRRQIGDSGSPAVNSTREH